MGGQLDEHSLFWQPTISIILYVIALYTYCLLFGMEIKYDDDDDDDSLRHITRHMLYSG